MTKGILGGMIGPMVLGGAHNCCRKGNGIASLFHGRDENRATACSISHARTGHPRHDHVGHHHHVGQPSSDVPHHSPCDPNQPIGDPSGVHEVPRKDEERDRQERKGIDPSDHALNHALKRNMGAEGHEYRGRNGHGPRNGDINDK